MMARNFLSITLLIGLIYEDLINLYCAIAKTDLASLLQEVSKIEIVHPSPLVANYVGDEIGRSLFLYAEAKGVAGLGKAGGDGGGGSDKAGQQVPPEVYIALTYAGTAFLFTLSVPLILYGLNKLLNKIEDCFGCGPSSKRKKLGERQKLHQKEDKVAFQKGEFLRKNRDQLTVISSNNLTSHSIHDSNHDGASNGPPFANLLKGPPGSQRTSPKDHQTSNIPNTLLPLDVGLNYKTSLDLQTHQQQPYIISGQYI